MRTILTLVLLFGALSESCQAMMEVSNVTKERAKELGLVVQITPNGPNEIWVELEVPPKGLLKEFGYVSIEIRVKVG